MSTSDIFRDDQAGAARNGHRLLQRIRTALAECNYAQRRMLELTTSADFYLMKPATPPDTYAEFLMRTAGYLRREPSARQRSRQGRRGGPWPAPGH
jgi:hypothetical protein